MCQLTTYQIHFTEKYPMTLFRIFFFIRMVLLRRWQHMLFKYKRKPQSCSYCNQIACVAQTTDRKPGLSIKVQIPFFVICSPNTFDLYPYKAPEHCKNLRIHLKKWYYVHSVTSVPHMVLACLGFWLNPTGPEHLLITWASQTAPAARQSKHQYITH